MHVCALLRIFALFCAVLCSLADLIAFELFCALLRAWELQTLTILSVKVRADLLRKVKIIRLGRT